MSTEIELANAQAEVLHYKRVAVRMLKMLENAGDLIGTIAEQLQDTSNSLRESQSIYVRLSADIRETINGYEPTDQSDQGPDEG